jgi:hypothetical protein
LEHCARRSREDAKAGNDKDMVSVCNDSSERHVDDRIVISESWRIAMSGWEHT